MRVLLIIDGMHPRDGGPPAVVAGSATAFAERGLDVTVLTGVFPGEEATITATWGKMRDKGVKLLFCPRVKAREIFMAGRNSEIIGEAISRADVVHIHSFWNPITIIAAKMARRVGVPYILSTHGVLDYRAIHRTRLSALKKKTAIRLFDIRSMFGNASAVIFGSETEAMQSWDISPGMNKAFIPNGVVSRERKHSLSSDERQKLETIAPQTTGWDRLILYYSRFHPEKGADMLVRAFSTIMSEFPHVGILMAGIAQDKGFQSRVEDLIAASPDPSRIVLTTQLTGPESQFLYNACDAFVLPSHAEGFSVALTEALAHGKPSLITRYCHMPQVESARAGFVVEPEVSAIAIGLRQLLVLSDEEMAEMGRNARLFFESNYTWERVAEQLDDLYTSVRR